MKPKTYIGIDYHKRYSVASAVDERGARLLERRIEGNSAHLFELYLSSLPGEKHVVFEACRNWARLYETLEPMGCVASITLSHPYKTRAIAEAKVKTDRLDARMLATLLRGDLVAKAHICSKASRSAKSGLRQRMYWVKLRTGIRNRVHSLIDRQADLRLPQVSDIFGARGMKALREAKLPASERRLLDQDLEMLEGLGRCIKAIEQAGKRRSDPRLDWLQSLPGVGPTLSAVIVAEIDDASRFRSAAKLCSYAGLVPSVRASGGKCYHGKMVAMSNKWLKWAFVEAAWVAVGRDAYFGSIYKSLRLRGKPASKAISAVARRMCSIAWHLLRERRAYRKTLPVSL